MDRTGNRRCDQHARCGVWEYICHKPDLFNDDILAIDVNQDITGTKLDCICPALYGRIEGMGRRGNDLLVAYKDMDKLRCLIDIGFSNSSKSLFTSLFIPGLDIITNLLLEYYFTRRERNAIFFAIRMSYQINM